MAPVTSTKINLFQTVEIVILHNMLKTHIPVYSTLLDKGLGTRKPIEWQRLNSQVEVRLRIYLSTGKYYLLTIIKSQVYYP